MNWKAAIWNFVLDYIKGLDKNNAGIWSAYIILTALVGMTVTQIIWLHDSPAEAREVGRSLELLIIILAAIIYGFNPLMFAISQRVNPFGINDWDFDDLYMGENQ